MIYAVDIKMFYTMQNVGKVKYLVNFYDGIQTHKDGSKFFDIKTFSNKKLMERFVKELQKKGYIEI
jgi:hypothetical protein